MQEIESELKKAQIDSAAKQSRFSKLEAVLVAAKTVSAGELQVKD